MDAIKYNVRGIKCDHPGCGYRDETVAMESYPEWLNRPCPECGSNLLTQADLDATSRIVASINLVNAMFGDVSDLVVPGSEPTRVKIEMNGTGEVSIRLPSAAA